MNQTESHDFVTLAIIAIPLILGLFMTLVDLTH